jgi:hypothetical protein
MIYVKESKDKDVNKKFASQGVPIIPFDVESSDASSALQGIDVLISTVAIPGLQAQYPLIKIAKAAGIKLFVPADWGDNTDGREAVIFRSKAKLREELESIGLPYASFFHGLWIDFLPYVQCLIIGHVIDLLTIQKPCWSGLQEWQDYYTGGRQRGAVVHPLT